MPYHTYLVLYAVLANVLWQEVARCYLINIQLRLGVIGSYMHEKCQQNSLKYAYIAYIGML